MELMLMASICIPFKLNTQNYRNNSWTALFCLSYVSSWLNKYSPYQLFGVTVVFITFMWTAPCHRSSLLRFHSNASASRRYILIHSRQLVDLIPSLKAINVACCGFSGLSYRTGPWAPHSDKRIRLSSY
jgi:hypothetical protein